MKTLLIIKPDGVLFVARILDVLSSHNITLCGLKTEHITEEKASRLYEQHREKYFFNGLIKYMSTAPCLLLMIKGGAEDIANAKKEIRALIKDANDFKATGDEGFDKEFRATFDGIHIPDDARAKTELSIFFHPETSPRLRSLEDSEKEAIVELKIKDKEVQQHNQMKFFNN
jgi:nucleoside-diphosphate kinase